MLVAYLSYMRVSQGCSVVEYEEMRKCYFSPAEGWTGAEMDILSHADSLSLSVFKDPLWL